MKKLMIATIAMIFSFTSVSAEKGINIGVSGSLGGFTASAFENEDKEQNPSKDAAGMVGFSSIFLEKTLGSRITVGVNYVPYDLESETAESTVADNGSNVINSVQVDFADLTTAYVALNISESFFIKAGAMTVDMITNESLGTGSSYGNKKLDGTMYGAGYNHNFDSGLFFRAEMAVLEFDGAKATTTAACVDAAGDGTCAVNQITMSGINGATGSISIGKSF
ncbi:hypothetical protein N9S20_03515 [Candidatus Pelagibacter sp.]|nr:hypothetical protein [Candidatus Pelagibacter sp.]